MDRLDMLENKLVELETRISDLKQDQHVLRKGQLANRWLIILGIVIGIIGRIFIPQHVYHHYHEKPPESMRTIVPAYNYAN